MGFVAALLITVSSMFLYEKVQFRSIEVAVGCLAVALTSFLVALVLAPWPIQLLLLLRILLSSALSNADSWP